MSAIEVKVPDIGDFDEVPVIEVLVKPGDTVAAEDALVTLESDKATMDVPSPAAGVVKAVQVKVGDKVSEGRVILTLEAAAAGAPTLSRAGEQPSPHPLPQAGEGAMLRPHPSPLPRPLPQAGEGAPKARPRSPSPRAARTPRRRCASSRASSASISAR